MFPNQLACILSLLAKVTVSRTAQADAPAAVSRRASTWGTPPNDCRLAGLVAYALAVQHSRPCTTGSPEGSLKPWKWRDKMKGKKHVHHERAKLMQVRAQV